MNDDFNFWAIIVGDLFYKFFWYFCVINLLFHFHKNAAFRTIASVDYWVENNFSRVFHFQKIAY